MNTRTLRMFATASLVVSATASTASASFITFNSIDSFVTENPGMLRDDVGSLSVDNDPRQHSSLVFEHMTISTGTQALSVWNTPFGAAFATEGDQYIHVAAIGMSVTIDFAAPIVRFGLHITDWGEWGVGSMWYTDNIGNEHTIATTPLPNGNVIFFGMESDVGISQIVLHRDNYMPDGTQYDGFGMDNFFFEIAAVPAPGALALLGIAGLVGSRRRRA